MFLVVLFIKLRFLFENRRFLISTPTIILISEFQEDVFNNSDSLETPCHSGGLGNSKPDLILCSYVILLRRTADGLFTGVCARARSTRGKKQYTDSLV